MKDFRSIAYERYKKVSAPDYDQYADAYRRRISHRVTPSSDLACLDIACGFGNFLAYLESIGVPNFTGVDSSPSAVDAVQKRFGQTGGVCADVFKFLGAAEVQYGMVSALDFLEHLSKAEMYEFLELVKDALSEGGQLLLRVPNASGLFGMSSRYNDITHELCFTPNSIRDVLDTAGLHPMDVWEDTGTPSNLAQWGHRLAWESVRLGVRCLDAVETGMWGEGILTRNMWVLAAKK